MNMLLFSTGIVGPQFAMRMRRFCKRRALSVLLTAAVTLLAAQGIAFQHDLDLESHAPDQVCELCITVAGLGGANVGHSQATLQPADPPELTPIQPELSLKSLLRHRPARGPPTAS